MSGISLNGLSETLREQILKHLIDGEYLSAKKLLDSHSDKQIQSSVTDLSEFKEKHLKQEQVFIVSKAFDAYLLELEKIISHRGYHVTFFLDSLTEAHLHLSAPSLLLLVVDLRACDIGMAQWLLLIKQHMPELKILVMPPIDETISINAPCRKAVLAADYILFSSLDKQTLEPRIKQILLQESK